MESDLSHGLRLLCQNGLDKILSRDVSELIDDSVLHPDCCTAQGDAGDFPSQILNHRGDAACE